MKIELSEEQLTTVIAALKSSESQINKAIKRAPGWMLSMVMDDSVRVSRLIRYLESIRIELK